MDRPEKRPPSRAALETRYLRIQTYVAGINLIGTMILGLMGFYIGYQVKARDEAAAERKKAAAKMVQQQRDKEAALVNCLNLLMAYTNNHKGNDDDDRDEASPPQAGRSGETQSVLAELNRRALKNAVNGAYFAERANRILHPTFADTYKERRAALMSAEMIIPTLIDNQCHLAGQEIPNYLKLESLIQANIGMKEMMENANVKQWMDRMKRQRASKSNGVK